MHDDDCGEADEQLLRGLFVQHRYDPDRHPHVRQLDGVRVDSRDDPERTGSLIRCGKKNLNLPKLSSIIGARETCLRKPKRIDLLRMEYRQW